MLTKDDIVAYAKTQGIIVTKSQLYKAERRGELKPCAIYFKGEFHKIGETKWGLRLYPSHQIEALIDRIAEETGQAIEDGWLTTQQVKRLYGAPPRQLLGNSYKLVDRKVVGDTTRYLEDDIHKLGYRRRKLCLHTGCTEWAVPNQEYGFSFCAEHKKQLDCIRATRPIRTKRIVHALARTKEPA